MEGGKHFHPAVHHSDRGLFQDPFRLLSNKLNGKTELIKTRSRIFTMIYKYVALVSDI